MTVVSGAQILPTGTSPIDLGGDRWSACFDLGSSIVPASHQEGGRFGALSRRWASWSGPKGRSSQGS